MTCCSAGPGTGKPGVLRAPAESICQHACPSLPHKCAAVGGTCLIAHSQLALATRPVVGVLEACCLHGVATGSSCGLCATTGCQYTVVDGVLQAGWLHDAELGCMFREPCIDGVSFTAVCSHVLRCWPCYAERSRRQAIQPGARCSTTAGLDCKHSLT